MPYLALSASSRTTTLAASRRYPFENSDSWGHFMDGRINRSERDFSRVKNNWLPSRNSQRNWSRMDMVWYPGQSGTPGG